MFEYSKEVREVSILRSVRKLYQFFVDKSIEKGTVLNDRYEIIRVIGSGSYGIVYQCRDLKTSEKKVVKQLRPSKRRKNKEKKLFNNEMEILQTLEHRNIPKLYDVFSSNRDFFYVMSFIEGDNFEDLIFLKNKTFSEKESLFILIQLLEIVHELHLKGIYHQDLRIPNIIWRNNQPYLIDFGLSKRVLSERVSSPPSEVVHMKQQDYYDLGEILLYLLYSTYSSKNKKALPWTEELSLGKETVFLLKRLLGNTEPYSNSSEILEDLKGAYNAVEKEMIQIKED